MDAGVWLHVHSMLFLAILEEKKIYFYHRDMVFNKFIYLLFYCNLFM